MTAPETVAPEPKSVEGWLAADVIAKVQPFVQDIAEEIAVDYDEAITDRDAMTEHLLKNRTIAGHVYAESEFAGRVWETAREVLAARGLPEVVADLIVEAADDLPRFVAEGVDVDMAAVAAVHEEDAGAEAARDYVRTESAAIARRGW